MVLSWNYPARQLLGSKNVEKSAVQMAIKSPYSQMEIEKPAYLMSPLEANH